MNAPAAIISGTFVKIESIATRKLVRIHIECPVEQANQVLAALGGYPDAANPVHVAVARLNIEAIEAAKPSKKDKREFKDLPPATQAALTCQEPRFWAFLREDRAYDCANESEAADYVRGYCEVASRSNLKPESKAAHHWALLSNDYRNWIATEAFVE